MSEELENMDFETDGGVDITPVGTPSPVAETVEPLKEDYKDDILDYTINQNRRYRMVNHSDGTVSFEDVTQYTQMGDEFGAQEINQITGAVNTLNSNLAQNNKLLWSGEWSSGTITIPELRDYTVYALKLDAVAHTILCTRNGSAFRGGCSILSGNAALVYGITLGVSQNNLTFTSAGFYSLVSNKVSNCAITAIIGVI